MALQKTITLKNGISYGYHRISRLRLEITEQSLESVDPETSEVTKTCTTVRNLSIDLLGYVSKDIRDNDIDNYVRLTSYAFELSEDESEANLREVGYNHLKQLEEYADAEDC